MADGRRRNKLGLETMHKRLNDHVYTLYLNYMFFIKGAVVTSAGVSFYLLFIAPDSKGWLQRMLLWLVSLVFSAVTVSTWSRGAIFTNWHANGWDFALPISTGILEALLYFVLSPISGESQTRWLDWYLIFGLFSISACLMVLNRRVQARPKEYVLTIRMKELLKEYRKWTLRDAIGSGCLGSASFAFWLAMSFRPAVVAVVAPYHIVIGCFLLFCASGIVFVSSREYRTLAQQ